MYISSIELNNYRNFRSNIIEFNKGINVIIGPYNSGKSNLLRAMALIFNPSEKKNLVKSKLLCKFPFDRKHGPDDLTYGR